MIETDIDTTRGHWITYRNPATGAEIGQVHATDPGRVAGIVRLAGDEQRVWGATSIAERLRFVRRWWRILARDAEAWADDIRAEIGKPPGEALAEVVTGLDAIRWTVKNAARTLRDERLARGWQIAMLIPPARLRWAPLGVVGMIGTWNYPFFLNAPAIAQAIVAGNTVVWKPSELAAGLGNRLELSLMEASHRERLPVATVFPVQGRGDVGQALIEAPGLAKILFTGGVGNGRAVLSAAGARGVAATAELSGFDAAVVLPDSPVASTVRALTWGAFVGAGQTCIAVKRVIVVGDPLPWAEALAVLARALRVGDPATSAVDLGPLIHPEARARFHATVEAAVAAGARVLTGGTIPPGPGAFYPPTVLLADDPATADAAEAVLAGCFGPVVLVRGVLDDEAAIQAANGTDFGLAASVWGRDRRRAQRIAERLAVGMVAINDAVTPSAHAAAPFGGTKASGFGRVRGVAGLRELTQPVVTHTRRPGGFRPHLFPADPRMARILTLYRRFFHRGG